MTSASRRKVLGSRSLRTRMVATFTGLAILPFVAAMAIVFVVARYDVGELQGQTLAREARLLAERVRNQVEAGTRTAAGLASMPEVRTYLAGRSSYPHQILSAARRYLPGLRRLDLQAGGGLPRAAGQSLDSAVSWGSDQSLVYRVRVTDMGGSPVGLLEAGFGLEDVLRTLEEFRAGAGGRAVLYRAGGGWLAGAKDLPLPASADAPKGWAQFEGDGREYVAGVAPVDPGGGGVTDDWYVAVVQSAADIYRPFYWVTGQVATLLLVLAVAVVALAWRMAGQFLQPLLTIRHGAEIISRSNLNHRIRVDTGDELEELASDFNRMAEALAGAYGELEERVRETTRRLQEERNRLATVLRTMVEGVVVTNDSGSVLLMNPRARMVLGSSVASGMGEPLGRLLPSDRVDFYFRKVRKAWDTGREAVERVVFPLAGGDVLVGSLSAVPGPEGDRVGFLLLFRVVGPEAAEEVKLEQTVREMPELLRGPVATARSLLEGLDRHPDMPDEKRRAFLRALQEEVGRLTERLHAAEDAAAGIASSRWPGVPSDPWELVQEAVASVPGLFARMEEPTVPVHPVTVEPFSWVAALTAVLGWLAGKSTGWAPVVATLRSEDGAAVASFLIQGDLPAAPEELRALEVAPAGEPSLPLAEVVRRNRGELWTRSSNGAFEVCLGLVQVPSCRAVCRDGIVDDQPEFYDFDLFLPRPVLEPEQRLRTALSELDCVVFDTETTGLQPSRGDEVVSLSAVRIRRGRVQPAETFHALVNPGRAIPPSSTAFHGIDDGQVADAPRLTEVLPRFYEFVGDAVLVAHNAAFDKKFLDLAAARAGLPYLENPILDTLFLSYGIHKDFEGHNLETIAERLGVAVEGRHTSMGDARATAAIFLELVQLLAGRGVVTLGDAKAFCDRMLLLRWQSSRF